MVLNFAEALILLDDPLREKTQAAWIHEGDIAQVGKSNWSPYGYRPKIRNNESRVDDERELLRVASSFTRHITHGRRIQRR